MANLAKHRSNSKVEIATQWHALDATAGAHNSAWESSRSDTHGVSGRAFFFPKNRLDAYQSAARLLKKGLATENVQKCRICYRETMASTH
jgi:hypothetical protein